MNDVPQVRWCVPELSHVHFPRPIVKFWLISHWYLEIRARASAADFGRCRALQLFPPGGSQLLGISQHTRAWAALPGVSS